MFNKILLIEKEYEEKSQEAIEENISVNDNEEEDNE